MTDLKKLHTDLINAKEAYTKCIEDIHKKSKEISDVNLEITRLKSRVTEIQRQLDNMKKGIGLIPVSADEFTSLKNELEDNSNKLHNLTDLLPIHELELKGLNKLRMSESSREREILSKMTEIFANEAASDVAISADSKLKELTYVVLAQFGFHFSGRPDDYDTLYKQIGEKICKNLFTTDTGSVVLPTAEEAMTNRDLLIENLV